MKRLFDMRRYKDFLKNSHGGTITLVALSAVPMVAFVGVGVDASRGYMVKSRLSAALDAAALAGGRVFHSPERNDDIRMFFKANFPDGYMGTTVDGPLITVDQENERIALNASAEFDTSFMSILGFDTLTVSSEAEIERAKSPLDVVLAIDMSGSMGSGGGGGMTRIAAARQAAKTLTNILYGNEPNSEYIRIGVVPWNAKVNVTYDGVAYDEDQTVEVPVSTFTNPYTGDPQDVVYQVNNSPVLMMSKPNENFWRGCVYSRYTDDGDNSNDADIYYDMGTFGTAVWPAWQPVGQEGEPRPGYWSVCSSSQDGNECTPCLGYGITPLNNNKQPVLNAIDALQYPNGTTNIPGGLGWAWRVLLPEDPFDEAAQGEDLERTRAIVLLTDGENVGGWGDGYAGQFGTGGGARGQINDRLKLLARNIKDDGVVIYTIQYYFNSGSLQDLMQEVASGPSAPYYHFAPDAGSLETIFKDVANHIAALRLTK